MFSSLFCVLHFAAQIFPGFFAMPDSLYVYFRSHQEYDSCQPKTFYLESKVLNITGKSGAVKYTHYSNTSAKTKNRVPPKLTHKTAEVTGYGEHTVRRIVAEKSALSGAAFSSPAKRYKIDRKKIVMDDFDMEALRSAVHEFYSEKKYPTMDSLLSTVKEKGIFSEERTTLWRVMRKMGFKYKNVNDKRYIYI